MYCLDTNILIDFIRGDEEVISKLNNFPSFDDFFITPINLCELFKGANLSSKRDKEINSVEGLINSFDVLDFTKEICEEFGKEYAMLSKIGKQIPEFDLIIACFAKVNNLILITRDKHFENLKNFGLKLEVF